MAKKGQIIQEKVISEALRIVQEEGQHNLTIRKITSNTGYNTGSIYAQFQNIDEIILKINSITLKRIKVLLLNITTQHKLNSLQNTLTTLTTEFINFAKQEENLWRLLFEYKVSNSDQLPDWVKQEITEVFSVITKYLEQHLNNKTETTAALLWSSIHGMIHLHINDKLQTVTHKTPVELSKILVSQILTN